MYQLILNLIPQGILPRINVSQYDHGQTVDVTLYEGSTAYTLPSNATVTVSGTKADNTGFEYNCDLTDGISFAIEEQMTVFAGEVECELTIRYGNNRISTINFILDVERAALQDGVVISETDLPIIQQLPEKLAEAETYADRAEQAAATAMSTDAGKVTDRLNLNNCRNLIVPADINYTRNGVTMKTNADGSITLSGTNTGSDFVMMYDIMDDGGAVATKNKWFPNGNYKLYGDTVGGRISGKAFFVFRKCDANGTAIGSATNASGSDTTFSIDDTVKINMVALYILASADFGTGMTIYPMITTQSTENVTGYEQGALSNRALMIKEQELEVSKADKKAIHTNFINPNLTTRTLNGITCTANGDGTFTLNGTASAFTVFNVDYVNTSTTSLPSGRFKLTGAKGGANVLTLVNDRAVAIDSGNGAEVVIPSNATSSWARITVGNGTTLNNVRVKPMLTTDLSAKYDDYVPYSGIGELNANVAEIYRTLPSYQPKSDSSLQTTNKTIAGAINELKARIDAL